MCVTDYRTAGQVVPPIFLARGRRVGVRRRDAHTGTVTAADPVAQVMGELDAAVTWAKKDGNGNTSKLGITGYRWGGRIVWLCAAHNPNSRPG